MPTNPADLARTLAQAEAAFASLSDLWRTQFPLVRSARINLRAMVSALFEIANAAEPERRKQIAGVAEKLADAARQLDIDVAFALAPDITMVNLGDDGSTKETLRAIAACRERLEAMMTSP
jgi:hypothetical protein